MSNYRNHWYSPYIILEKFFFWRKNYDAYKKEPPKWLQTLCEWNQKFLDTIHPKIQYVKIDPWDTWSMDYQITPIILPMLKELQKSKHGAPCVDDEDVPYELKSINDSPYVKKYEIDAPIHFARWEYVMNQMIFAFECKVDDSWEDLFRSGKHDTNFVPSAWDENGKVTMHEMLKGPNDTYVCDYEGMREYEKRIQNGFRLLGKYYQNLWD